MNDMWPLAGTSQSLNGPSLCEPVSWSGHRELENSDMMMGAESLNAETRMIETLTLGCSTASFYEVDVSYSAR